jgi:xanthine dehydrogenase/oxidase
VIGAIVAETQAQAQRAVKAVKIEYEDLPRVLSIEACALLCDFAIND